MADYRGRVRARDLTPYRVRIGESDLFILTPTRREKEATEALLAARLPLKAYIDLHPEFALSLMPIRVQPGAPEIVKGMAQAANIVGVGPMAAVAGAIAQAVGKRLSHLDGEAIVENGGDIYIDSPKERIVALFAGDSPLSMRVGLKVCGAQGPLGVCTSSGRVGHSLSFGKAHSVTVVASDAAVADAAATALANMVRGPDDIGKTLERAKEMEMVEGAVVIFEDHLGAWGHIELVHLVGL